MGHWNTALRIVPSRRASWDGWAVVVSLRRWLAVLGVPSRLRRGTAVAVIRVVRIRVMRRRRLAASVVVVPAVLRRIARRPGARMLHRR